MSIHIIMTSDEIDTKIEEYVKKLNHKVQIIIRKGKKKKIKTVGIPQHLAKYYKEEIAKLYKEKQHPIPAAAWIDVPWENVRFENNFIRLKVNSTLFSEPYQFLASRQSFELIKSYIIQYDLPPLRALSRGTKIHKIENLENLFDVIEVLTFTNNVKLFIEGNSNIKFDAVLKSLQKISNVTLSKLLKLREKGPYLCYLCDIQDKAYKIIPATELFVFGTSFREEDTFIFTVERSNNTYVIWESVKLARATYVFKVLKEEYVQSVQKIYEFIINNEPSKRSTLRSMRLNPISALNVIQHYDVESWTQSMKETLV